MFPLSGGLFAEKEKDGEDEEEEADEMVPPQGVGLEEEDGE